MDEPSPLNHPTLRDDLPRYPPLVQLVRVTTGKVDGPSGSLYVSFTQQLRTDTLLPRDREPCLVADVNGLGLMAGHYIARLAGTYDSLPVYEVTALGPIGSFVGVPGPQGSPGPAGSPGPQGSPGPAGSKGDPGTQGERGPQGPPGPAGSRGDPGTIGPTGSRGDPGTQGGQGPPGPTGATGPQGAPGPTGSKGDPGTIGPVGSRGDPGTQGTPGPAGSRGDPGTQGSPGATGPTGPPGPAGSRGDPGTIGPVGSRGDPGTQGSPGPQGPPGPAGSRGDPGTIGPVGSYNDSGDHSFTGLTTFQQLIFPLSPPPVPQSGNVYVTNRTIIIYNGLIPVVWFSVPEPDGEYSILRVTNDLTATGWSRTPQTVGLIAGGTGPNEVGFVELRGTTDDTALRLQAPTTVNDVQTITMPADAPSAGDVLSVASVAGSTVTLEWAAGGGGSGTRTEGTLAAAGTNQATAAAITTDAVEVTGGDGTKGVILPTTAAAVLVVWNSDATNAIQVYPPTGAQIGTTGTNNAYSMAAGEIRLFVRISATQYSTVSLDGSTV